MCFVHRFNSMSQILSYLAKFHCLRKCVFLISSSTVGFILHWLFSFSFWFATFYAGSVNAHTHWLTPIYTHPLTHPHTRTHTLALWERQKERKERKARPTSLHTFERPVFHLGSFLLSFLLAYVNFCASLIACHMAADAKRMPLAVSC